ncbi:MAG: DNA alkylation repair protein [Candidatus Magasanikbacteria bacterium]
MTKIITKIRKELRENSDKKYASSINRWYKEPVKFMGVKTPTVRKIAEKYWQEIKHLDKKQIFGLCEELLKGNQQNAFDEEATISYAWVYKLKNEYSKSDWKIFERWLKNYVSNWGKCDDFCTHAFGELLSQYPEFVPVVKKWTKSKNRWVRRASAVIFIKSNNTYHTGKSSLQDIFYIADALLLDSDDLVQKGYGWMLKVASFGHQKQVFEYVMKNKDKMPRTALRYAIEKMPDGMRKRAMAMG